MLSGALLLPVETGTGVFLRKRLLKIAIPIVLWTTLYLVARVLIKGDAVSWKEWLSIPFSAQGNPTFWFLYTLIGLYLISPIISKWLKSASQIELEFYLVLWLISLLYPVLKIVLSINTSETGILYYVSGYVGYFVLGYYMRRYSERVGFRWIIPAAFIAFIVPVVCKMNSIQVDFYSLFWYLSIFVVILCIFIWKVIEEFFPEHTGNRCASVAEWLSRNTFGVYLIHFFVIRYALWNIPLINSIHPYCLQTIVIAILAFLISVVVTYLISLLPCGRYMVGLHSHVVTCKEKTL
jgi:surface polysaccharide O-acyltransferase-like enzyme